MNSEPIQKTPISGTSDRPGPSEASPLTQRAYLNGIARMLEYATSMAVSFFVSPIVVTGLGSNLYGVFQMLNRLTSFAAAADGRPTQALQWFVAHQQNVDDDDTKKRAVGSALFIWLGFSPAIVILGAIIVWLSTSITKVSADLYLPVRLASALLAINLFLYGIANLPEATLKGMNLNYKRILLRPGLIIIDGILTATVMSLGLGLVGLTAKPIILSVLSALVYWGTIKRYVPWFGVMRPARDEIRTFFSFGKWYPAWTLVNKLMLSSDVVVLGIVATTESVTTYTLTGYVAYRVVMILAMIVGAVMPGLGGLIGKKQYDQAADVRSEMMAIDWLLSMIGGVCILMWNRSFISLWIGESYYGGDLVNLLYTLIAVQLIFIRSDAFVIDLTLDIRRKVILGSLSALLSVILSALLIKPLGIVGLCLGYLAGRSVLSVAFPLLVGSALDISPKIRVQRLIRPGAVMLGAFLISNRLGQYAVTDSWIEFFGWAGVTFVVAGGIGFFCGLTGRQRKAMINRFSRVHLFGRA